MFMEFLKLHTIIGNSVLVKYSTDTSDIKICFFPSKPDGL